MSNFTPSWKTAKIFIHKRSKNYINYPSNREQKQRTSFWQAAASSVALIGGSLLCTNLLQAQAISLAPTATVATYQLDPQGLAADSKGNLYVANELSANQITELLPNGQSNPISLQIAIPKSVAIDGAGNIFALDGESNSVYKLTPGGAQTTVSTGLNVPVGIAADSAGNLYIAEAGNGQNGDVLQIGPSGTQTRLNLGGVAPRAVAVDKSGHIYVASAASVVTVAPVGSKTLFTNPGSSFNGLTVDNAGNVFVTDSSPAQVWQISAEGGPVAVAASLPAGSNPSAMAADGNGNVFFTSVGNASPSGSVSRLLPSHGDFGRVNVCSPGQTAPCTSTLNLTFNVNQTNDFAAPMLASAGSAHPDFAVGNSTCKGYLAAGTQCTLTITFTPQAPGLRTDAVFLYDSVDLSEKAPDVAYIHGVGVGSQLAFGPGVPTSAASIAHPASGIALDKAGNLYVTDYAGQNLLKVAADGTSSVIATGLPGPSGVAVDAVGNIFVSNRESSSIFEIKGTAGGVVTSIGNDLSAPSGVAVDGAGNLYVADTGNTCVAKIAPSGVTTTIGSGFGMVSGIAVDASGNVFVADQTKPQILEIAANGTQTTRGSNLTRPTSIAVDAAGNLYVTEFSGQGVIEIAPDGSQTSFATDYQTSDSTGVAVDASGDVFFTKSGTGYGSYDVVKWARPQTTAFNFGTQAKGTDSAPLQLTVQNIGNAPLTLASFTMPANFNQENAGQPGNCSGNQSLAPATSCNLSIVFAPPTTGSFTGNFIVGNNGQNVSLQGTGALTPQVIVFNPATMFTTAGPVTQNTTRVLNATASSGLPVSYTFNSPYVCNGSGSVVHFINKGACVITASQPGNADYQPAQSVTRQVAVN